MTQPCCLPTKLPDITAFQPWLKCNLFLIQCSFGFPKEFLDYGEAYSVGPCGAAVLFVKWILIIKRLIFPPNVSKLLCFNVTADNILIFFVTYIWLLWRLSFNVTPIRSQNIIKYRCISTTVSRSRRLLPIHQISWLNFKCHTWICVCLSHNLPALPSPQL